MVLYQDYGTSQECSNQNTPRCYTVNDIAQILGVNRTAVYSLIKKNLFRVIRIPGSGGYRIPKQGFDAWFKGYIA